MEIQNFSLTDFNSPVFKIPHNINKHVEFYSSDDLKTWKKGRKILGTEWAYYNTEIEYKFNSHGYRSPEIDSIGNDEFFITFGCSHTNGIGVPEGHRYSNLLSSELNIKYLNFGHDGSAQNLIWLNTVLLNKNLKRKPKFVVCQWPSISRLSIFDATHIKCFHPTDTDTHSIEYSLFKGFLLNEKFMYNTSKLYFETVNLIWKTNNVPVINFSYDEHTAQLFDIKFIVLHPTLPITAANLPLTNIFPLPIPNALGYPSA
jgi:hypothetical protein